jgi:predicted lipoprotein with Yx(FWY)xxD motif
MSFRGALGRLGVSLAVISAVIGAGAVASADEMQEGPIATTAGGRAKIKLLSSPYGPMLFTGGGQALYLFKPDGKGKSRCYGDCAAAWPPLKTQGDPIARGRVRPGLLGTTRRAGGARQVTYGGHPLYTYANESRRQVLCHNVFTNGGLWLAVKRNGTAVAH